MNKFLYVCLNFYLRMRGHKTRTTIILCLEILCNCLPHSRVIVDKNISRYKVVNGEPIAVAHLIREYERDHLHSFNKSVNNKNDMEWKDLENKDLDNYCRRYLHQCVPGRNTCNATGSKGNMKLRYTTSGYERLRDNIVVVSCTYQVGKKFFYYMTRAIEPNCVYALSRVHGGHGLKSLYTIIYKHCDFELHDYDRNKKQKRRTVKKVHDRNYADDEFKNQYKGKGVYRRHHDNGQLIADDESIMKYELEHQEMLKRETAKDFKRWPFVVYHRNLNEYCYTYLNVCIPNRNIENTIGSWKLNKVRWRNKKDKFVQVVVVKCYSQNRTNRSYYFTRALDKNCVYALLRDGKFQSDPFLIIFKYCNFDYSNIKQEDREDIEIANTNMVAQERVKTESLYCLETLQLFPEN